MFVKIKVTSKPGAWHKVVSKMILEHGDEDKRHYALIEEDILESQGCFVKKVRLKLLFER